MLRSQPGSRISGPAWKDVSRHGRRTENAVEAVEAVGLVPDRLEMAQCYEARARME